MAMSYFNVKKLRRQSKQPEIAESSTAPPAPTVTTPSEEPAASPVLNAEDERFLQRLAAIASEPEGTPPPLPSRPVSVIQDGEKKVGREAQEALVDGADKIPLPMSPPELPVEDSNRDKSKGKDDLSRKKSVMSYFTHAQARIKKATEKDKDKEKDKSTKDKKKDAITSKDKQRAADSLHLAAESAKAAEKSEAQKEEQDLTIILDQLNLSAVNNRVFSFSTESEELFNKFKLVLKDIINGVPTAYNDLEKLFTDYEATLKKMYGNLPPFLQNMVKSLPTKITTTLGPELMAAQAEKPGFDAKQKMAAGAADAAKKSKRAKIPSLKSLISAEGAVATMLKSILNFLKLRFPAVMTGTNVVMSLAVCCEFGYIMCSPGYLTTSQCFFSCSGTAINAAVKPVSKKNALPRRMQMAARSVVRPQLLMTAIPSLAQNTSANPARRISHRRSLIHPSLSRTADRMSTIGPERPLMICLA